MLSLRLLLLFSASIYAGLFLFYSNKVSLFTNLSRDRKWTNIRLNNDNQNYDQLKANDIYLRKFREYNNGDIEIDETKVIETSDDLIIYQSHKESAKSAKKNYNNNINTININNENTKKKKYIFSLRYYEQLSKATKNLLSLVSLATHYDRHVVMPYVNNSRFSGLRLGATLSRYLEIMRSNITEEQYIGQKFGRLDSYFDLEHLQNKLRENKYTELETFQNFRKDCQELDVVVHFLYADKQTDNELPRWYKTSFEQYQSIKAQAASNNGVIECHLLKKIRFDAFLRNVKVKKYLCVDPEIITTAVELEKLVFKGSQCIGILSWKGNGNKRTHFDDPPTALKQLSPSDLKHNKRLINIAYQYIREVIKRPFISVHVRSERNLLWKSVDKVKYCITKLGDKIKDRKRKFSLKKIFVANDLEDTGSGTLKSNANESDRISLRNHLYRTLDSPFKLDPTKYKLHDRGEIAIVEMHILSMGESLFTVGEGNFQEWIIDLFLLHNAEDRSLIYKVCDINNKKIGL